MNKQNKIFIASLIRDKKSVLFGKFSDIITHSLKVSEWQKIFNTIKSNGLLIDKDWKYLRDVVWQNFRCKTVAKVDNSKKTGAAGGPQSKLTDLDNIIIDIVGKDSPIIKGIYDEQPLSNENEQTRSTEDEQTRSNEDDSMEQFNLNTNDNETYNRPQMQAPKPGQKRKTQQQNDDADAIVSLRKKRLELEIYNLQLDPLKKEKEMGLPRSQFTTDIDKKHLIVKSNECRENESEMENTIGFHNF